MSASTALIIRPNMPNPINRIPNTSYRLGRRTTTLKRLREMSEPVPSIAFLMMGHGSEGVEYKTVPKGCVLVVPTKSGETVIHGTYSSNQLKFLDSANRAAILDPVGHKTELYNLFGPVSIFTEGEQYPNFDYTLFSYNPSQSYIDPKTGLSKLSTPAVTLSGVVKLEDDIPANPDLIESIRYISSGPEYFKQGPKSGVIAPLRINPKLLDEPLLLAKENLPDISVIKTMSSNERKKVFKDTMTVINPKAAKIIKSFELSKMYKFSNGFNGFLNSDWAEDNIQEDLEDYSKEKPRPMSLEMTVKDYIEYIFSDEERMDFTQEELFKECGPGVYYNFICRSIEDDSESNPFQLTTAALHGISEAETGRKKVVRNAQAMRRGRRGRKQKQRVNGKTRKRKSRI
jgi:hypothetical protein